MRHRLYYLTVTTAACLLFVNAVVAAIAHPHIVLVMADDQGWGEMGYNGHPLLKTPHLDAMSANGLRFDRFYAGAPVCSPTRASVLTGRSNMRTGVNSHGYALRRQERTLPAALKQLGYVTGHFGKWHLNGIRGPGVPILADDTHVPGVFGFDSWLSVSNFFDRDPILSREGVFEEFTGDSSEIVVAQALQFIERQVKNDELSFTVIWFGTPHSPFRAAEEDMREFGHLDESSRHHYGELVALDRSIGTLRAGLRKLDIARDTLVWYCSDNGGLPKVKPETVGGLRGFKGSLYEGGLRVPAIIEWPAGIPTPRVTHYPAVTMDIFPTIGEIVGLPIEAQMQPSDGLSLVPLFEEEIDVRAKPIPFSCLGPSALLDNNLKLIQFNAVGTNTRYELYDLKEDPHERENLYRQRPADAARMSAALTAWLDSVAASIAGHDYPERKLLPGDPEPRFWMEMEAYRPYIKDWKERPEYQSRLRRAK